MTQLFVKFIEKFKNNEIAFIKRKPNLFEVHVVAMDEKLDSWKQLKK